MDNQQVVNKLVRHYDQAAISKSCLLTSTDLQQGNSNSAMGLVSSAEPNPTKQTGHWLEPSCLVSLGVDSKDVFKSPLLLASCYL